MNNTDSRSHEDMDRSDRTKIDLLEVVNNIERHEKEKRKKKRDILFADLIEPSNSANKKARDIYLKKYENETEDRYTELHKDYNKKSEELNDKNFQEWINAVKVHNEKKGEWEEFQKTIS